MLKAPQLPQDFGVRLTSTDSLNRSVENLNRVVRAFHGTFLCEAAILPAEAVGDSKHDLWKHALADLHIAHGLIGRRIGSLLCDVIMALNNERALLAALAARGALESCAWAVHCASRVTDLLGGEVSDSDLEALISFLHKATTGGRFDWHKAKASGLELLQAYAEAESDRDTPKPPDARLAVNVMTMLNALDARVAREGEQRGSPAGEGLVRVSYAMLSDFCHPAFGTALTMLHTEVDGSVQIGDQRRALALVFDPAITMVAPAAFTAQYALGDVADASWRLRKPP